MREERPWGSFEVLAESKEEGWKVKRIEVNPGSKLSLQYHTKRDETWTIISGTGTIVKGTKRICVGPGSNIFIVNGEQHRVEADGDPLIFIEVQQGECDEEDIVRLEDDYGRVE